MFFSVIIPVYNRPNELKLLLNSLSNQTINNCFETVIIEDGSTISSEFLVKEFKSLEIKYFFKINTGPGDSRNFGMKHAKGDYFLLFDSDCILPNDYFEKLNKLINKQKIDFFGGLDTDLQTFSKLQRAINFVMTSVVTMGKVRGNNSDNFQPRSFNMGLSRQCFEASGGFSNIHPGEDPDLVMRLWKLGFKSTFFEELKVYHQRRINFKNFFVQINKFGKTRAILDKWYPEFYSYIYWFPSIFTLMFFLSIVLCFFDFNFLFYLFIGYFSLVFILSLFYLKSFITSFYVLYALIIQFFAYGIGYLYSKIKINLFNIEPKKAFPNLFFKQ